MTTACSATGSRWVLTKSKSISIEIEDFAEVMADIVESFVDESVNAFLEEECAQDEI